MGDVVRFDRGIPCERMEIAETLRRIAQDVERGRVSNVAIATTIDEPNGDAGIATGVLYVGGGSVVGFIRLLGAISVLRRNTEELFEEGV